MSFGQAFFLLFGVGSIAFLVIWIIIDEHKVNKQMDKTREAMKTNQSYPPTHKMEER